MTFVLCHEDSLSLPVLYRQPMPITGIDKTLSRTVWPIVNCSRQTVRRDHYYCPSGHVKPDTPFRVSCLCLLRCSGSLLLVVRVNSSICLISFVNVSVDFVASSCCDGCYLYYT